MPIGADPGGGRRSSSSTHDSGRRRREFNNHGLPGTYELREEQYHIEVVLRQDYPDPYAQEFDNWNQWDNVEFDHPQGVLDPDCRLCVLLARHKGVNLQEPA